MVQSVTSSKSHASHNQKKITSFFTNRTQKKKKPKISKQITGCTGTAVSLRERQRTAPDLNPYSFACSVRCRHPLHIVKSRASSTVSQTDWIPEHIYKKYTETDSRPQTPEHHHPSNTTITSRRSASVPRTRSTEHRKATPEPETKQCQFHERRILILDLRRVKSVDVITRQNSLTTGTSFDDSTYADDDVGFGDNRSHSSVNPDSSSIFYQLSPRNLSVSRSTTPNKQTIRLATGRRGVKKSKERSASPAFYDRSSSPKILEGLTLPPLHSSVLTLLGQRPGTIKASPRNLSGNDPGINSQSGANSSRQKKLRRHRRKGKGVNKGNENQDGDERNDEDNNNENHVKRREGSAMSRSSGQGEGKKTKEKEVVDDPHDTQMSAMSQTSVLNDEDEDHIGFLSKEEGGRKGSTMESIADLNARRFQSYIEDSEKSLHQVLDEQLGLIGVEWNPSEMKFIDDKIKDLQGEFKKYETKFKAGNIRMKEDMWLSLPRTWSRASATFSIPTDLRLILKMTPLEYIAKYIFISEPRKHLYSLVFNRYLISTNPTGKMITYMNVQKALVEVLGRQMTDEESIQLKDKLLYMDSDNVEVDENLFRGICAVTERIFGKYNLEDCDECYTCLKYKGKDKTRCHKNQKDQLERVDFEYVSSKIKDGHVQPQLAVLLQAVFDRG